MIDIDSATIGGPDIFRAWRGYYLKMWLRLPSVLKYKIFGIPEEYKNKPDPSLPAFLNKDGVCIGPSGFTLHSVRPYHATQLHYDDCGRTIKNTIRRSGND